MRGSRPKVAGVNGAVERLASVWMPPQTGVRSPSATVARTDGQWFVAAVFVTSGSGGVFIIVWFHSSAECSFQGNGTGGLHAEYVLCCQEKNIRKV